MKLRVLLFCSMLVALALAATAAARSQQVTIPIDDTFQDELASEACGFDVTVHIEGTLLVTLILDQEGDIVREIDRFQGGTVTYSSATGSFSFPTQTVIFDYGEGAEIGSEATIKIVGLFGHAPGFIPSDAGLPHPYCRGDRLRRVRHSGRRPPRRTRAARQLRVGGAHSRRHLRCVELTSRSGRLVHERASRSSRPSGDSTIDEASLPLGAVPGLTSRGASSANFELQLGFLSDRRALLRKGGVALQPRRRCTLIASP